jgi:hypothetical protein
MNTAPRVLWMPGGVRTEIHLDSDDTGGAFCMVLITRALPAGRYRRRHQSEAETST